MSRQTAAVDTTIVGCSRTINSFVMIPFDDPPTFNATVDRFFRRPFVKKDRVGDLMKSLEKLRAAEKSRS